MIEKLIKLYILLIPISFHLGNIEICILIFISVISFYTLLLKSVNMKQEKLISFPLLLLILFIGISTISEITSIVLNHTSPWILDSVTAFGRIVLLIPIVFSVIIKKINLKLELLIGSIYSIPIAFVQLINPIWNDYEGRVSAGFSHPNFLSYYLIVGLSILLFDNDLKIKKFYRFFNLPFFVIVIFLTGTRSVMILAALIALIWIFFTLIKYKSTYIWMPILISINVLYLYINSNQINKWFSTTRFTIDQGNLGSYSWRKVRWNAALESRQTDVFHFLFGGGWQSSSYPNDARFYGTAVHNEYIRLFLDTGFLGILIFSLFIVYLVVFWIPRNGKNRIFNYSIIVILMIGMYIDNLFLSKETLMLFMILSTYLKREYISESEVIDEQEKSIRCTLSRYNY